MTQRPLTAALCLACRTEAHRACSGAHCACADPAHTPAPRRPAPPPVCGPCAIGHHHQCVDLTGRAGTCGCPHRADPAERARRSLEQLRADLAALLGEHGWAAVADAVRVIDAAIPERGP